MAINIDSLPQYVEEHRLPILRNAVLGSKSAKEFYLQTACKGKTALNLLNTNIQFGDGSACGWSESGSSVLSQRYIEVGYPKVNMSFCDKSLLKTWMNYEVRVAAGQKQLPFEEDFVAGVVEGVQEKLEEAIWQGDTSTGNTNPNTNKFDGMKKILNAAEALSGLAGTYTITSADTVSQVIDEIIKLIPSAAYRKGEVRIYTGEDNYRKYIKELIANGNIVFRTMGDAEGAEAPASIIVPGTKVRIMGVGGLDGQNFYAASYKDNFVYGTDMEGDEEKAEMWYSQDNREFRLAVEFSAGVQVAFPDMVATAHE